MRKGYVDKIPGFDGEYGTIKIFQPWERSNLDGQMDLFHLFSNVEQPIMDKQDISTVASTTEQLSFEKEVFQKKVEEKKYVPVDELNEEQKKAVYANNRRTAVIAGPGTGKTKTLVSHMVYLLETRKVKASEITAVTLPNQAALEMKNRVDACMGNRRSKRVQIGTFHALCLAFLRDLGEEVLLIDSGGSKRTGSNRHR